MNLNQIFLGLIIGEFVGSHSCSKSVMFRTHIVRHAIARHSAHGGGGG